MTGFLAPSSMSFGAKPEAIRTIVAEDCMYHSNVQKSDEISEIFLHDRTFSLNIR